MHWERRRPGVCYTLRLRREQRERRYESFPRETCINGKERFMKKNLRPIPKFKTEAEERRFWEDRDSTRYVDWPAAKPARFPNLKPSTQSISLRLPTSLLDNIKIEANRRDVPYQSLIKVWLAEKTEQPYEAVVRPRSTRRL